MTLSADALAALERSAQVLGGVNRREGEPTREASAPRAELIRLSDRTPSELHPLVWTNTGYVRRPLGPGEGDDAISPVPPADVEPGWSIVHARRLDTDESGGDVSIGRTGVVYDTTPAGPDPATGEALPLRLHAAALPIGDGSRRLGPVRLDASWPDDVAEAHPAAWASVRELLACAYRELATLARRRRLSGDNEERRDWLLGVTSVLEGVRRARGWRS